MILPKPFLDKLHLRSKKEGNAQRLDMSLKILDKSTPLPLPVEYKDIDAAMQEWVDKELNIVYDGEKLPTFKMFANQRLNEYSETWQHIDKNGNLLMNFKTITRENNPQKGENQGAYANIPGDRDYPMFLVPTLQDNQQIAYDMYSMKQPFCVNLKYNLTIVTNKIELINQMNSLVHDKFKAITTYVFPNNHAMPLTLENVEDESEYNIDDRKYYSQSFSLLLKAYIIKQDDFKVTKLPSRVVVKTIGDKLKRSKKKNIVEKENHPNGFCMPNEDERYYYKKYILKINFGLCEFDKMILNNDFIITKIETNNIYDFSLDINGEKQNFDNEIRIYQNDEIFIKITKNDILSPSVMEIEGYDPNIKYDSQFNLESSLDENKPLYKEY